VVSGDVNVRFQQYTTARTIAMLNSAHVYLVGEGKEGVEEEEHADTNGDAQRDDERVHESCGLPTVVGQYRSVGAKPVCMILCERLVRCLY
jgi:hypothetical protein